MKFGSKEWFQKVEELHEFPAIMAAYLSNKTRSINSMVVQSKAFNVGEIKYSKVAPYTVLDSGEKLALLEVKRIHNSSDYYDWVKRLKEDWYQEESK